MDDLYLSPLVILRRLPQLWFEALHPNPMVNGETQQAVSEKLAAIGEGLVAAQSEMLSAMFDAGTALLNGQLPSLNPMERITEAALAPARIAVRANMRRLSQD